MEHTFTVDLKWFHFSQNNSGGYFKRDENLAEDVWIQARNAKDAEQKAEALFSESNYDSCPCCGDRWSIYVTDEDGTDEPMRYNTPARELNKAIFQTEGRLHHFDGRVETLNYPE